MEQVRPSITLDDLARTLRRGDIKIEVKKTSLVFTDKKKKKYVVLLG